MSKLLDISDLTIAFDDGPNVVENVSLSLDKGEIVALVGESGSGKSVTALSILRLLDERHVRYPSGRILFHDQNLLDIDPQPLRRIRGRQISMIFQEPMTSLNPLHTVEKQITETLALHRGLRNQQARDRCVELLELVGITNAAERLGSYPHQLSGGQKQRVMIAMALANEPDLLIADEPTTALDVTVQKQVLELLQSLQHRLGMGILLITHDLSIVRRYADRVVVMEHGRVVEQARTATLFSAPRHPYTRSLLDAEPPASPPPVEPGSEPLLAVTDLNVRFTTRKSLLGKTLAAFHAVQNVSFELTRGETLGIVGESGSGKTTIGHALLKLTQSDGDIRFGQDQLSGLNQRQFRPYRRRMQIVFQDPFGSLSPRMSIAEIVREGLLIHDADAPDSHDQKVIQALTDVGLDPASRHRYPHEFSGGQRQRVAIARALVLQPDLIILDEPTSALDRTVQKQVIELLRELQARYGLSYVFISHDLAVVRALSHKLLVLKDGKVVEQGSADAVFTRPQSGYTRALLDAALFYQQSDAGADSGATTN